MNRLQNENNFVPRARMEVSYPKISDIEKRFPTQLLYLRNNAQQAISKNSTIATVDKVSKIDILLEYSSALIALLLMGQRDRFLETELVITMINIALLYQQIAIELMQKAYDKHSEGTESNAWSISGIYLRKGLGILQFLQDQVPDIQDAKLFNKVIAMISEFNLLQQLGILILSLTKLKDAMTNDESHELVLQTNDLKNATSSTSFYAKLTIGCLETVLQLQDEKNHNVIINKSLKHYLEGLSYLLLSLVQFRKDECGVAIGLLEQSINSYSTIVPRSNFTDTILSTQKLSLKKKDFVKNKFQSTFLKTKLKSKDTLHVENRKDTLLPLLLDTLNDFIIPLITLLNYVYQQTNDKLFFLVVERDAIELRKLFPKGICPNLQPLSWIFQDSKLQQDRNEGNTLNSSNSANDQQLF